MSETNNLSSWSGLWDDLQRCSPDSQLCCIKEVSRTSTDGKLYGILVVYVDDFLLQATEGPIRTGLLITLGGTWKLDEEVTLSVKPSLSFLGIDMVMRENGDVFLHQERFVDSLLET